MPASMMVIQTLVIMSALGGSSRARAAAQLQNFLVKELPNVNRERGTEEGLVS